MHGENTVEYRVTAEGCSGEARTRTEAVVGDFEIEFGGV